MCLCISIRVCICVCCVCTNFAQYLPGEVSSVVGTKGAMWFRPHTLAGFAWWRGQYHQSNEIYSVRVCASVCGVCVRVCMYDSFFSFLTHIGQVKSAVWWATWDHVVPQTYTYTPWLALHGCMGTID